MKKWSFSLTYFLHWFFMTSATAGGWVSGGGDATSLEFISYGYRVYDFVKTRPEVKVHFSLDQFKSNLDLVSVNSKESLFLDGVEKDEINYPFLKLIDVNRANWQKLSGSQKAALALHEYLGMSFLDKAYDLSVPVLSALSKEELEDIASFSWRCKSEKPMNIEGFNIAQPIFYMFNLGRHVSWLNIEGASGEKAFQNSEKCTRTLGNTDFGPGTVMEEIHCGGERGFVHVNLETVGSQPSNHFVNIAILGKGYGDDDDTHVLELIYYTAPLSCEKINH